MVTRIHISDQVLCKIGPLLIMIDHSSFRLQMSLSRDERKQNGDSLSLKRILSS